MKERFGIHSIFVKQLICFALGNVIIVLVMTAIFLNAFQLAREEVYDRMNAQSEYYLETLDAQLENIYNLEINFFYDRRLVFLMEERSSLSDYERRDALLSLEERLQAIQGCSNLIQNIYLFIPNTNYMITPSSAGRMQNEEDWALLNDYMQDNVSGLHINENGMYFLEADRHSISTQNYPSHIVSIILSREEIQKTMQTMIKDETSGAFFYRDASVILDTGTSAEYLGSNILSLLKKDETGIYEETQRVKIGSESYLVITKESPSLGTFVQYSKEAPIMYKINRMKTFILAAWLIILAITVIFILYTQRLIHTPMQHLLGAFNRVKKGNFQEHIEEKNNSEFAYLYEGFNEMEDRIQDLIQEVYEQKELKQRAELKQLQEQINPHFLYNSLFSIRSKIYREEYESAEELTELLGRYFRYLTRNAQDYVELSQEVDHAYCYARIQASRFAARMEIRLAELPEEMQKLKVPRLIIQPLLENALEYGLGDKEENGLLAVSYEEKDGRFYIHSEDNGSVTEEVLEKMRESLQKGANEKGEVTGMINIHRRLQLYYGGRAGLEIRRSVFGGTCVTICLEGEGKDVPFADRG